MKKVLGIYLMIAGTLMGLYLVFNVYLPTQLPAQPVMNPSVNFPSPLMGEGQGEGENHPVDELISLSPSPLNPPPLKGGGDQGRTSGVLMVKYDRPEPKKSAGSSSPFAVPDGLKKEVDFWTKIYAEYTTDQAVLHDPTDLGNVYGVIDLPHCDDPPTKECLVSREEAITAAKAEYADKLGLERSKKVVRVYKDSHHGKKRKGKKRARTVTVQTTPLIRAQVGQRDKFLLGIYYSESLLPQIEEIFNDYGIPHEITRLPFVESMFNIKAYSHAGAQGIWQLMPSTARILGLKVGRGIDERKDPVKSAGAAAKHLKRDYNRFGSWPLALNAYNTGPGRISGAMNELGTKDIVKIVKNYQSSGYGFAARNFYPCFLAALRVYENRFEYFKELLPAGAMPVDTGETANK